MRDSVFLLCLAAVLVLIAGPVFSQSVTVDHIDGLEWDSTLAMGLPIVYHLRFTNDVYEQIMGFCAGFRIYSPDGADWTTTTIEAVGLSDEDFDLTFGTEGFGVTGTGSDTVGLYGARLFGTGMPLGYDAIAATITIGPVGPEQKAKTICLDSCWFPPACAWQWDGLVSFVVMKRVPMAMASAPSVSAAAKPRPSAKPPAAMTGISRTSARLGIRRSDVTASPCPAASLPVAMTASVP